jgi:hypothetical protein
VRWLDGLVELTGYTWAQLYSLAPLYASVDGNLANVIRHYHPDNIPPAPPVSVPPTVLSPPREPAPPTPPSQPPSLLPQVDPLSVPDQCLGKRGRPVELDNFVESPPFKRRRLGSSPEPSPQVPPPTLLVPPPPAQPTPTPTPPPVTRPAKRSRPAENLVSRRVTRSMTRRVDSRPQKRLRQRK